MTFHDQYAETIKKYYKAEVGQADLHTKISDLLKHPLNQWATKTVGYDFRFFRPYEECSMILANILNFQADWNDEFKSEDTALKTFHNLDGTTRETEFLVGEQNVSYAVCELGRYVRLSYKNAGISFKVFVPEVDKFADVDYSVFNEQKMKYRYMTGHTLLNMPKFDLDVENDLREVVLAMGFDKLFVDKNSFSSMAKISDPSVKLGNLLDFKQNVKVSVDEKGSKVVVVSSAGGFLTDDLENVPDEVVIDSPYLFQIEAYGQTIVAGRITTF